MRNDIIAGVGWITDASSARVRSSSLTAGIGSGLVRSAAASAIASPPSRSASFSTSMASSDGRTPLAMPRSVQSSTPRFCSTSAAPLRANRSGDDSWPATSRHVAGPSRENASFAAVRTDHSRSASDGAIDDAIDCRRALSGERSPACTSAWMAAERTKGASSFRRRVASETMLSTCISESVSSAAFRTGASGSSIERNQRRRRAAGRLRECRSSVAAQ